MRKGRVRSHWNHGPGWRRPGGEKYSYSDFRDDSPENPTPDGISAREYRQKALAFSRHLKATDPEAWEAIRDFTNGSYSSMRSAQSTGDTTSPFGRRAVAAERAFRKVKKGLGVKGVVVRGLSTAPRALIDQLMADEMMTLAGTASTSRSGALAHDWAGTYGSHYRVLPARPGRRR